MSTCAPDTCETCSARIPVLEKLGIKMSGWDYLQPAHRTSPAHRQLARENGIPGGGWIFPGQEAL
jgi:hypothetical protein